MLTSRQITAALRPLTQARLATRASGTDFHVFFAHATAGHMGLNDTGSERGREWLSGYLSRHLPGPVHVVAVKVGRPDVRGRTTMVTVRPGECPGPGCPAG